MSHQNAEWDEQPLQARSSVIESANNRKHSAENGSNPSVAIAENAPHTNRRGAVVVPSRVIIYFEPHNVISCRFEFHQPNLRPGK